MDVQEIQETLKDAKEYLINLKHLNDQLSFAMEQVEVTANETEVNIKRVFESLVTSIKLALLNRRDDLLCKTSEIREQGLKPLLECQKVVENKIENTSDLINLGQNILKTNCFMKDTIDKFSNNSSLLGSLPEVPDLKDVPHLSFQHELNCEKNLIDTCQNIGSVIHSSPVQISFLEEKPGAVMVRWNISENDDLASDVQEYELQRAFGNLINYKHLQNNFRTCYKGSDTHYLVKDVVVNEQYTFRVRCKLEGEAEWSPWSLLEICSTRLMPFSWRENQDFILSNKNTIAKPLRNSKMLFSNAIEFKVGFSVDFTFLECDINLHDTFVGLFATDNITEAFRMMDVESICVEATGNIYECGSKKSTQFPPVIQGTTICFTCELQELNKFRINIDSKEKRVTYDWHVNTEHIFFGARFNSENWKIMLH